MGGVLQANAHCAVSNAAMRYAGESRIAGSAQLMQTPCNDAPELTMA